MSKAQKSISDILSSSVLLFEQNGYSQTSMRQIAAASNVSLGLINHYFGSKTRLGALTLDLIALQIANTTDRFINRETDPVLYDAVITRSTNVYLLNGVYRQFYIDCLHEDVFWSFLNERSVKTLSRIMEKNARPALSQDELDLYGKYLPYSIEKTLVLHKEQGLFPSISYDQIPDYILRTELERFVDAFTIQSALDYARTYTRQILEQLPSSISKDLISQFCQSCLHI